MFVIEWGRVCLGDARSGLTLGAEGGGRPAGLFKEVDKSFKPVADMLKKKAKYDAAVVQQSAAALQTLAVKIPDAFGTGYAQGHGNQNQSARISGAAWGTSRQGAKRW